MVPRFSRDGNVCAISVLWLEESCVSETDEEKSKVCREGEDVLERSVLAQCLGKNLSLEQDLWLVRPSYSCSRLGWGGGTVVVGITVCRPFFHSLLPFSPKTPFSVSV